MTIDHGMDPEAVEQLGRLLQRSGTHLDSIATDIDRMLRSSRWEGDNAVRFLQVWPRHRNTIRRSAQGLSGLGQSALNNASEQRNVSGKSGAVGHPQSGAFRWSGSLSGLVPVAAYLRSRVSLANDIADTGRTFFNAAGGRNIRSFPWAGPLAAVNLTAEIAEHRTVRSAWTTGEASGDAFIRSSIDVAWAAGSLIPVVGAVNAAWNTGYHIGSEGAEFLDQRVGYMDAILADTRYSRYGAGELTPTQSAELSRRYDGVSGFGNFAKDLFS